MTELESVVAGGVRHELRRIAGAQPTLVFLHEGLGSTSMWRDFPDQVAARLGAGALVYTRRGYGGSGPVALPRQARYMHEEAYQFLPSILEAIGLDDVVLIGHSDGASIALLYAAHAACHGAVRVRGVVAIAPHVMVEDLTVASIQAARESYETADLRSRLARHHGENVDMAFRGWNDVWLSPEFRAWNIESEIAGIRAPILLVQGDHDPYGTLAQLDAVERAVRSSVHSLESPREGAAQAFPARHVDLPESRPTPRVAHVDRLVMAGCGHSPFRDRPEETADAIAGFVRRLADR